MEENGIEVTGLWKKFKRGELHDSLRDLVPAAGRRLFRRGVKADHLEPDDFWALKDVSFEVRGGEAMGVMGQNGVGKSTLLKILSGILRPNRGSGTVRGKLRALIEVAAGFHPDLTGRENVFLNGAILGMGRREVAAKLDEIVEFAGIGEFLDTPVKRYSSGMFARLGFSVAAHMEPDVLLVDEILAVGDLEFQRKCLAHMRTLTQRGVAVVLVSHNMSAIAELCDRTLVLAGGEMYYLGPTDEAERAYLTLLKSTPNGSSGAALVGDAWLAGEVNRPKRVFQSGESCVLHARVRVGEACRRFAVGLSLLDTTGTEIFHSDTMRLGSGERFVEIDDVIDIRAGLTLNLAGGTYSLQVKGLDYSPPKPTERRSTYYVREVFRLEVAEFEVRRTQAFGGVAYLQPTITYTRDSTI